MYTANDLSYSIVDFEEEDSKFDRVTRCREYFYKTSKTIEVKTLDGKFKTITDHQGYSYWYTTNDEGEFNFCICHRSYEYLLIYPLNVEDAIKTSLNMLNKILEKYPNLMK